MNNDDLIGKSLGQFEIIDQIGRGGMASVYRARQTTINRIVAVKVLPRTLLHDPSFYERFAREVDVVAHLEHPHILPIYDYGESDGIPYIAMRYLAGGSMAQWIRRGLPPLDKLPKPIEQISSALDYAHQQGVIHRDLKPGNVMLDENGNAYLSDFGIARVLDSNLTGSAIIGTPAYMSPEQANGLPLDARSDIYSLGVVLFELITGREPFEAETPVALLLKHINEPMPSARAFRPELPPAAEQVINKATAKHPEQRYASASDLADAFSEAIHHPTTSIDLDEDDKTLIDPRADDAVPGGRHPTPRAVTSPRATAAAGTALHEGAASVTPAAPPRRRSYAWVAIPLVLIIIVAAAAIGLYVSRGSTPPTPAPTVIPTPFAQAYTVQRAQYTISMPEDWTFKDVSGDLGVTHVWTHNNDAYIAVWLVEKTKLVPQDTDFLTLVNSFDAQVIRTQSALTFIDEATAPDGSLRRSYQFSHADGSSFPPGQIDLFYENRGKYLAIVEDYSAYSTGNTLVPTFQSVLDSFRVNQT